MCNCNPILVKIEKHLLMSEWCDSGIFFPLWLFMLCIFFNEHVLPVILKIMGNIQWAWAVLAVFDWLVKKLSCSWSDVVKVKPRLSGPLIRGQFSDLSMWLEGNACLEVFCVLQTHHLKDLKDRTSSSPTYFLLLDSRKYSLSTRVSVAISAFLFLPFSKDTHQVFFCTSGQ